MATQLQPSRAAPDEEAPADSAVIRVEAIKKTYVTGKTEVHALRGVSVTIERGEMVAIMGASGSGKSTLMNILGCLDRPTSGEYWLDGVRVDGMTKNALADIRNAKIGFVFQGFNLLARTTAVENVELPLLYHRGSGKVDTKALSRAALERVGLGDRMDHEPSELSGGQQQRVAIARALVTSPALVLADEPTGNLDTHTSVEVLSVFQELNAQGITIVLVTHEHDIAQYCKRVVELRDGHVVRDSAIADRHVAGDDLARLAPEVD